MYDLVTDTSEQSRTAELLMHPQQSRLGHCREEIWPHRTFGHFEVSIIHFFTAKPQREQNAAAIPLMRGQ